ncbi:MAG TPA: acyl-CoA dehydrogenase family protein, partial [Acidimicrobiales bacterium]
MSAPDLNAAASAVDLARDVVQQGLAHLAATGSVDADQAVAYDLAHAAAAVETARTLLDYGARGGEEASITAAFAAEAVADVAAKLYGREAAWGCEATALDGARAFVAAHRDPAYLASIDGAGPRHLDDDFEMVQDAFRRFADDKIRPVAEHVHRHNADIPEDIIAGLAEIGAFGLSVPEEYGGFAAGGESDYMGMVV